MKPFWMIALVFPDIEGSQPQILGGPVKSYAEACNRVRERAYGHPEGSSVVILQAMAHTVPAVRITGMGPCHLSHYDGEAVSI
jgi:hypothetical protein